MIDQDPDFWPTMEEAEQMAADAKEFWKEERLKRSELYSVWQDYEEILFMCDKCKHVFRGEEADLDYESKLVAALLCPKCGFKLVILRTEALPDELRDLASKGHKKALEALK